MAKAKTINGFEILSDAPPAARRPRDSHRAIREALRVAGVGKWIVIPVPPDVAIESMRSSLLQNFRAQRTGWTLTTRSNRETHQLFIARVA